MNFSPTWMCKAANVPYSTPHRETHACIVIETVFLVFFLLPRQLIKQTSLLAVPSLCNLQAGSLVSP